MTLVEVTEENDEEEDDDEEDDEEVDEDEEEDEEEDDDEDAIFLKFLSKSCVTTGPQTSPPATNSFIHTYLSCPDLLLMR